MLNVVTMSIKETRIKSPAYCLGLAQACLNAEWGDHAHKTEVNYVFWVMSRFNQ